MGMQALRMASGKEACAWSPTEIAAASEALDRLKSSALSEVGDEGLAGLVVMFGLALRRAAPNSPGISDAQRTAYTSLYSKLLTTLSYVCHDTADHVLSPRAPLEVCTALIKTHALRAFCPLLAAAASPLLPAGGQGQLQPRPSSRAVQAPSLLLEDVRFTLGVFCDALETLSHDDSWRLASALHEELAASGLLEHWALALALASWEEGEDGAVRELPKFSLALADLLDYGDVKPWARALASGSCPSLAYLLTSHLVALAAELDGGPTYGLPTAPADGSTGGASSSSSPPPKARLPIPLLDAEGYPLRPRQPLGSQLAAPALSLWTQALSYAASTATGGLTCGLSVNWAGMVLTARKITLQAAANRLLQLKEQLDQCTAAAAAVEAPGAVAGSPQHTALIAAQASWADCCGVFNGVFMRGNLMVDCSAAFQLGMRLARAAAYALRGCPDLLLSTSTGKWSTEAAVQALIAAHETAAWTDPDSPPLQLQGAEAAGRLSREDAGVLAWRGLRLAREARGLARHSCDWGCPSLEPWLLRRLGAWWRAAVAWAGLWQRQEDGTAAPIVGLDDACRLLHLKETTAGSALDFKLIDPRCAVRHGYLAAVEAIVRQSTGPSPVPEGLRFSDRVWADLLLRSSSSKVASVAGTTAKLLLRAARSPERCSKAQISILLWASLFAALASTGPIHRILPPENPGRLALSAAHVALTALPAAAALGRALAPGVLRRLDGGGALELEGDGGALGDVVALLLDWLPPLLVAAEGRRAEAGVMGGAAMVSAAVAAADAADSAASSAASSVAADSTAPTASEREWSAFLWTELGPAWALRVGLRLAETAEACHTPLKDALWALAVRAPSRLQAMVPAAGAEEGQGGEAVGGGLGGPSLGVLRRVLVPGGALSEPDLLALIEVVVGCGGGASGGPSIELSSFAKFIAITVSLMPPPSEARQSLPVCSNPACTNLAGPSEASLRVKRCGGCEAARYCCRECQAAHWEAGHKRECRTAAKEAQATEMAG
ncbi:hypothetical protein HYH03_011601 [Edaphochlamys debaryana]|uniref:phytol kinase n=1 Tax=Edaphochlamys debaryana TaxID=47281 RepID=A0A836BVE8_9CHLO|nr:hypothetical protein HYH03_011601 [Edaphochlamys debaryana]|eukprot:KAG2489972.1 hypothetical protein HYH03_011601 [Edaphochlamys debaryana]